MNESGAKSLSWNVDTVYALGLYRLIGRCLGIWPLNCQEFGSRVIFLVVIILQLNLAYNLIGEFASGCISVSDAVDYVALFGANGVCLLKITVIRIHRAEMRCIIESAVIDWSLISDEKSREIMRIYARRGRLISLLPIGIGITSTLLMLLQSPPSLDERNSNVNFSTSLNKSFVELRNLPMGTGCSTIGIPKFLYLAFYCYQSIQILCSCTWTLGCDAIFYGVSMHLCGQFRLLDIDVASFNRNRDETRDETRVEKRMIDWLERHNRLLHLLNLVENIFHVIIFGLLATSGTYIILLGIQMLFALRDEAFMIVVHSSISIACLLVQLFTYCFVGDYLTSHASKLQIAAYSCGWYNYPRYFAKNIIFMIMMSSRSYRLTAGKILSINIESFTSIVKTMGSFFSVMKLVIVK